MQHRNWVGSFVVVQTSRRTDIYLSWGEVMTTLWEKKEKKLVFTQASSKENEANKRSYFSWQQLDLWINASAHFPNVMLFPMLNIR